MEHLLENVGRTKLTKRCQDGSSFEFEKGVLEFDTATAVVQRRPSAPELVAARRVNRTVEKRARKFLAPQRKAVQKKPSSKTLRPLARPSFVADILCSACVVSMAPARRRSTLFCLCRLNWPIQVRSFSKYVRFNFTQQPPLASHGSCQRCPGKGHGAGAESLAETIETVTKKLRKGSHIAAADGSPALQSAAGRAGTPSLKGISHIKHLFTPLSVTPMNGLLRQEIHLLRNLAKQGCAQENRLGFTLVGGENVAESCIHFQTSTS